MENIENEKAPFSADELNGAWHRIFDRYLMENLMLEKQVNQLQAEILDLKAQLHQSQVTIAQRVIDDD